MLAIGLAAAVTVEQRRNNPERKRRRAELGVAIQRVQHHATKLARKRFGFGKLGIIFDSCRQISSRFAAIAPRRFI
jgi:hypothetical protein